MSLTCSQAEIQGFVYEGHITVQVLVPVLNAPEYLFTLLIQVIFYLITLHKLQPHAKEVKLKIHLVDIYPCQRSQQEEKKCLG